MPPRSDQTRKVPAVCQRPSSSPKAARGVEISVAAAELLVARAIDVDEDEILRPRQGSSAPVADKVTLVAVQAGSIEDLTPSLSSAG